MTNDEVRLKLADGTWTWEEALAYLTGRKTKAWQTKEWKAIRDSKIGHRCEQCQTESGPFVLQHFTHPMPFSQVFNKIGHSLFEEHLEKNPLPNLEKATEERDGCPICNGFSIRKNKTTGIWTCNTQHNKRKCGAQFETPVRVTAPDRKRNKEQWEELRKAYIAARQAFFDHHREAIGTAALKVNLEEWDRYLSCDGTATFCKKCAFLWDIKGMQLCHICRKNYHPISYVSCAACHNVNDISKGEAE